MHRNLELASYAVELAETALSKGTYAVGGLIVTNDGKEIIHAMHNQVAKNGVIVDPTAHGERQLVDWYFQARHDGMDLPEPKDLTIVTSLDPCVMCTGAILASGFKVISISLDEMAGICMSEPGNFKVLPQKMAQEAAATFSYFKVVGKRDYSGHPSIFSDTMIPLDLEKRSSEAFIKSLSRMRELINSRTECRKADDTKQPILNYTDIAERMLEVAREGKALGARFNAVGIIDSQDRLLLCSHGQENISPARTAYLEAIRNYTEIRNDSCGALPHIKDCTVLSLLGPSLTAGDLASLGAYGSAIEGPTPLSNDRPLAYILPTIPDTVLDQFVKGLPPLYSQIIKIDPQPHAEIQKALSKVLERAGI